MLRLSMKTNNSKLFLLSFACSLLLFFTSSDTERQYKLKAGFLFRFLSFVQWPDQAFDVSGNIIIGILGENPFGNAFKPVEGNRVGRRKLVIEHYDQDTDSERLKRCHLLFISSSMENRYKNILKALKGYPVLTVSEIHGFADSGGMIRFITDRNNVVFVINNSAAARAGIKIRSKLLRLAAHVIKETE